MLTGLLSTHAQLAFSNNPGRPVHSRTTQVQGGNTPQWTGTRTDWLQSQSGGSNPSLKGPFSQVALVYSKWTKTKNPPHITYNNKLTL